MKKVNTNLNMKKIDFGYNISSS